MAGKNLKSKSLAACGVLCSLGTVLLLVSGWIGVGTYAGPLLAVWILSPLPDLYGRKYAIMSWLVVSFLSLLLVSDKELVVVYLFFGWYPVLKKRSIKCRSCPVF